MIGLAEGGAPGSRGAQPPGACAPSVVELTEGGLVEFDVGRALCWPVDPQQACALADAVMAFLNRSPLGVVSPIDR